MKTLALFSLCLAVALGMPSFAPQHPVKPSSEEEQKKTTPVSVDGEQSQSLGELEHQGGVKTEAGREPALRAESPLNAGPEVKVEPEVKAEPEVKVEPEVKAESKVKVEPFSERQDTPASRCRWCTGVVLQGKCYHFFKERKAAADAEFFCQERFTGGHLASITSQYIHREVMSLIQRENGGYTRTWVGGLRYLQTGRFIWLDGSRWSYQDWLSGEPNDTAGVEDCVEVLAFGNGKFNDFTCWEPQAFICSYPYQ